MKRSILICTGILFLTLACGGKKSKTYKTPEGKVEVSQTEQGQVREMKITTKEGTATMKMGTQAIPKDVGVPVYPGVKPDEGGNFSMSGTGKGQGAYSTYRFSTSDPVDQVAAFYHQKLDSLKPEVYDLKMPAGRTVGFTLKQDAATFNIVLTENKDRSGTNIQISKFAQ